MKKLLTIALLMLTGLTVGAQEGTWSTGMNEADELKGLLGGPYYRYDVEGIGSFILWDWGDCKFRIITDKGKFDEQFSAYSRNWSISISMGLYSPDGKLTEKVECPIESDHSSPNTATINKNWNGIWRNRKKIKKMISALKSGEGYVRIVCKRKDISDFDLKITKYDISEENSTAYKDYPQVINSAVVFCDVNDYSTPDEISDAIKNNTIKSTTLKKGERFKVVSLDVKSMNAKIQLPNGKIGWIDALKVPNQRDFLPYVHFREKFRPNLQTSSVAPGMTREEVFVITGNYLRPGFKSYKAFKNDYIWYNYTNADYIFYKNSLYFASSVSCKGVFYYNGTPSYRLVSATRNESVMDNNISSYLVYKDELLNIAWSIDRNKVNFNLKNNASSSIKILWDDMAFVGLNNDSHRVIHKGIKYSEKEKEQAPSIVARNTELHDLLIPSDNIYYKKSWEKWSARPFVDDFLYSPEDEASQRPDGKKIQVLLPIIVNEKRYEYQFVFEIEKISFYLMNSDYKNSSRASDEL